MGKGLEGVVAARTSLSHVYGDEGRLIYRGYEIEDLAEQVTYEEICHLLWFGELPNAAQLTEIRQKLNRSGKVDARVLRIVAEAQGNGASSASPHPMALLRTGVSALGHYDADAEDLSPAANLRKSYRLTAQSITLTAAIIRGKTGQAPIEPNGELSLAENLLYMITGERPLAENARIMDVALTLHAEHGMNASTFAARVAAGTLTDMHSAVVAAMATLKGPLHGGANEQVMTMLEKIESPERAAAFVKSVLERGEKVMGFGHRVYRTLDPRAPILKRLASAMNERMGGRSRWLAISEQVQTTMREEMDRRGKRVYPNVDFFSASVYNTLGIPRDAFTNIFSCARMVGWTAHIMEQYADNRLIRPESEYTGPQVRKVPTLAERT